jgi:nitronate monooxygenase
MLRTRLTKLFGLDYPIMSAPMAMHSGGHLAAAVSKAGALGSFGGIQPERGADWLRSEIAHIRSQTDRDFAVGFITHLIPIFRPMFDAVLEEQVPVIAFSFADPAPYVAAAKQSGATVVCQVQSLKHAREAVAAGADVLVAQGNEAGGHTGIMNLLPLLVSVIGAHPEIPVLAAGGITSGRALAAVLAAGADGAWLGTALLATPECIEVTDAYKNAIVESAGDDTVYTSVLDVITVKVFGLPPWPDGIAERVRREPIVDQWTGREAELRAAPELAVKQFTEDRARGDQTVLMGQGAGMVKSVRPASDVIREMCEDAERILRERVLTILS